MRRRPNPTGVSRESTGAHRSWGRKQRTTLYMQRAVPIRACGPAFSPAFNERCPPHSRNVVQRITDMEFYLRLRLLIRLIFLIALTAYIEPAAMAQCGAPTASASLLNTSCGNHGSLVVNWTFPGAIPESLFVSRTNVHLVFKDQFGNIHGDKFVGPGIGDPRLPVGGDQLPPASWYGYPGSTVELTARELCGFENVLGSTFITGPTTVFTVPNYDSVCPITPPPPPPPKPPVYLFQFAANSNLADERVLLHKYDSNDTSGTLGTGLESPYQVNNNLLPPTVRIEGAVTADGHGDARDVYFRVVDPPDTAPYAPHGSGNDNLDTALPQGKLYCYDGAGNRVDAVNGVLRAFSNHDGVAGRIRLFLETSPHVSGENYQIESSFEPTFTCATAGTGGTNTCPRSVTFVTWKRMYVERDQMFRRGSFITKDIGPTETVVPVDDIAPFGAPGTVLTVRLVHAPKAEVAASEAFYAEDHTVTVVAATQGTNGLQVPAHLLILDQGGLRNAYDIDSSVPNVAAVKPWLRDGVGVIGTGSDFFVAEYGPGSTSTRVENVFAAAFVELRELNQQIRDVPFAPPFKETQRPLLTLYQMERAFADKWCQHCIHVADTVEDLSLPNHIHLLAGNEANNRGVSGESSVEAGNFSWVYVGAIEKNTARARTPLSGLNAYIATYETVAHELAHQWRVNQPNTSGMTWGHCSANAYSNDGTWCRMHEPWVYNDPAASMHNPERADGKIEFHYTGSGATADSEYLTIRRAAEPVPNN